MKSGGTGNITVTMVIQNHCWPNMARDSTGNLWITFFPKEVTLLLPDSLAFLAEISYIDIQSKITVKW